MGSTRKSGRDAHRLTGLSAARVRRSVRGRIVRATGRFAITRRLATLGRVPVEVGRRPTMFPEAAPEVIARELRERGLYTGLRLPEESLSELLAWACEHPCYGNRSPEWGFRYTDRKRAEKNVGVSFTVGWYFNSKSTCDAVERLAADPVLVRTAQLYLGPRARLLGSHAWWSFVNDVPPSDRNNFAQMFHFDLDDFKFLKFFFYLTDVDEGGGPHVYVQGTNRRKKLSHMYPMRRLSDHEVVRAYGSDSVATILADAGEGFVEDTFGLHKGLPPTAKDRLLLQVEFGTSRPFDYQDDVVDHALLKLCVE